MSSTYITKAKSEESVEQGSTVHYDPDKEISTIDGGLVVSSFSDNLNDRFTSYIDSFDNLYVRKSIYFDEVDNGNLVDAATVNWKNGNKQVITLTDHCTLTFTDPYGATNLVLRVVQDEDGNNTITWPDSVKWPSGSAPTLTSAANSVDIITFYFDGTYYYGVASQDFS